MENNFTPGFLDYSKDLYINLSCCVLQAIIRGIIIKSSDGASPKDALVRTLTKASENSEDKGTCKSWLSSHQSENFADMLSHMDITVCCCYLLNGGFRFSKQELDAIHAVRKSRNLSSHGIDTSITTDKTNELLWRQCREALSALADAFPEYVDDEIRPQIEAYHNGTAGKYRAPSATMRERLQYALDNGNPNRVFREMLDAKDEDGTLKALIAEYSEKYEDEYLKYLNSFPYSMKLLSLIHTKSFGYALRYSRLLETHKAVSYLADCAKRWTQNAGEALTETCSRLNAKPAEGENPKQALLRAIGKRPELADILSFYLTINCSDDAERRYWVRRGIAYGCRSLVDDFTGELSLHLSDIEKENFVDRSDEFARFCDSPLIPKEARDFIDKKECEQILALLRSDAEKQGKELSAAWLGYQKNPRVVDSRFPEVREAVDAFGRMFAEKYWRRVTDYLKELSQKPCGDEHFQLLKDFFERDSDGNVVCRLQRKNSQYCSMDVPEYQTFRDEWLRLRERLSRYHWTAERERIEKLAAEPFSIEKLAVSPDDTYDEYLDKSSEEYRLFEEAWKDFRVSRTNEYWRSETEKLSEAIERSLKELSRVGYVRDRSYNEVLVTGTESEKAWKAKLARYDYLPESIRLKKTAEEWDSTAYYMRRAVENALKEADTIDPENPRARDIERLKRGFGEPPRDCPSARSAETLLEELESCVAETNEGIYSSTRHAYMDFSYELHRAKSSLDMALEDYSRMKRFIEECEANLKKNQQQTAAARAKRKRNRTIAGIAAVLICLAAVWFLSVMAIKGVAASKAAKGQLLGAYELLDKTAFLDKSVEKRRVETLNELRAALLAHGFRDGFLTDDSVNLVKGTVIEGRTDIEIIPSNSVLVYTEKGRPGLWSLIVGKYPTELMIPSGYEIKSVWGESAPISIEINVLCTDGTVLSAKLDFAASEYEKIAGQGIDLNVSGHMDGVRMVIRWDGSEYHWMDDGRLMEGDKVLYRGISGFKSDEYGRMSLYTPVLADGRYACAENVDLPDGMTADDIWEFGWYDGSSGFIMNDGRLYISDSKSFSDGNDILFDCLDVYDRDVKKYFEQ